MKAKLSFRKQKAASTEPDTAPATTASAPETATTPEKKQADASPSRTDEVESTPKKSKRPTSKSKHKAHAGPAPAPAPASDAAAIEELQATVAQVGLAGMTHTQAEATAQEAGSGLDLTTACALFGGAEMQALQQDGGGDDAASASPSKAAWKEKKVALEVAVERVAAERGGEAGADQVTRARRTRLLAAACVLAQAAAPDSVAPVSLAALDLAAAAFKVLSPHVDAALWASAELRGAALLGSLVPALLAKMGDTNKRIQREVCRALVKLAQARSVSGLRALLPFLAHAELNGRALPLRPRLAVLRMLLSEFGFQKGKLNLTLCMGVAVPALSIADDKTRKAAIAVVVAAHKACRYNDKRVERHLKGVKPAMLTILHRKFGEARDAAGEGGSASGGGGGAGGNGSGGGKLRKLSGSGALPTLNLGALSAGSSTESVNAQAKLAIAERRMLGPIAAGSPGGKRLGGGGGSGGESDTPKYSFQGNYGCGGNELGGGAAPRRAVSSAPAGRHSAAPRAEQQQQTQHFQSQVMECGDDELMDSILADTL
eukprot:g2227.t1